MTKKIEIAMTAVQNLWQQLKMDSVSKIGTLIGTIASDFEIKNYLQEVTRDFPKGFEIHRDQAEGFILLAYAETKGTYRAPHNHGNAWVVYAVVSGEVEMGSYMKSSRADGTDGLVLKSRETLKAGDTQIYLSGEIHDTFCKSKSAVVLRFTSVDLHEEEKAGRMKRYQPRDM